MGAGGFFYHSKKPDTFPHPASVLNCFCFRSFREKEDSRPLLPQILLYYECRVISGTGELHNQVMISRFQGLQVIRRDRDDISVCKDRDHMVP